MPGGDLDSYKGLMILLAIGLLLMLGIAGYFLMQGP